MNITEAIKELEEIVNNPLLDHLDEQWKQALSLALTILGNMKEERLMKIIPEIFGDIYPLCIEVNGYTKNNTVYKIKQEERRDLAQAILKMLQEKE